MTADWMRFHPDELHVRHPTQERRLIGISRQVPTFGPLHPQDAQPTIEVWVYRTLCGAWLPEDCLYEVTLPLRAPTCTACVLLRFESAASEANRAVG